MSREQKILFQEEDIICVKRGYLSRLLKIYFFVALKRVEKKTRRQNNARKEKNTLHLSKDGGEVGREILEM